MTKLERKYCEADHQLIFPGHASLHSAVHQSLVPHSNTALLTKGFYRSLHSPRENAVVTSSFLAVPMSQELKNETED